MPTNDSDELIVAGNGQVHVAAVGSALPANIAAALDPALYRELGYVTEDGAKFTDEKSIKEHRAWQSFYPVRRSVEMRNAFVGLALEQWNEWNVALAFGGGSVSETSPGMYEYVPPDPEEIDERVLVLSWQDGDKSYRIIIPKGMVTNNVETSFMRSSLSTLPIVFSVTPAAGEDPWVLQTDDPAFELSS